MRSITLNSKRDLAPDFPDSTRMRAALLLWYDKNQRDLPWRAKAPEIPDAYRVLVSEIMLQQTTVATVTKRYGAFLKRFPTVNDLADADIDEVLHAWQGLGYYRRARGLHGAAREIRDKFGGVVPTTASELQQLSGIGPYTAAAVAAIAFEQPIVPIDGNVARVLLRLLAHQQPAQKSKRELEHAAQSFAATDRSGDLAQAVMELGALVCKPTNPLCQDCPWEPYCVAKAEGLQHQIPIKAKKQIKPTRYGMAYVIRRTDGAILLRKRPDQGVLAGMIEVPSSRWEVEPDRDRNRLEPLDSLLDTIAYRTDPVVHVFTHFRLILDIASGETATKAGIDGFWQPVDRLEELALPTLTRKILRHAGITA